MPLNSSSVRQARSGISITSRVSLNRTRDCTNDDDGDEDEVVGSISLVLAFLWRYLVVSSSDTCAFRFKVGIVSYGKDNVATMVAVIVKVINCGSLDGSSKVSVSHFNCFMRSFWSEIPSILFYHHHHHQSWWPRCASR
mmetsp:Transcript_25671/g.47834  ORF Transcript_25671/g.47834 Transcript_25671/m.47834 type:complete len:139 (+) Transcript_25671:3-419(+)